MFQFEQSPDVTKILPTRYLLHRGAGFKNVPTNNSMFVTFGIYSYVFIYSLCILYIYIYCTICICILHTYMHMYIVIVSASAYCTYKLNTFIYSLIARANKINVIVETFFNFECSCSKSARDFRTTSISNLSRNQVSTCWT